MKKLSVMVFMFLASLSPFFGEDEEDDEDVILVNAGKIQQTLEKSVDHVQVVSDKEIKESGAKNLTEAMKNLPGVTVKTASPGNPTDSISMQGFSGSYVKILVDGIEVSGDISGSPAVNSIPLEDVDHIEVVQGASSSLYGSDAMGGVINVITKKSKGSKEGLKWKGSLTEEASLSIIGDFRNYAGLQAKMEGKKLSAGVTGSFDYAPGAKKSTYDVLAGKIDYYETPEKMLGYAKATAGWNDYWGNLGVSALCNFSDQLSNFSPIGFDAGSTMEYDTKRYEGSVNGKYDISDNIGFSGFSSAKYFKLFTEQDVKAGEDSNKKDDHTSSFEWESELRNSWKINSVNMLLSGFHANLETIDGDSFSELEKQWLLSFYTQDTVSLFSERLSLVPGIRLDWAPSEGSCDDMFMLTPKLSLKYDLSENSIFRFAYGMGYKVPTLKQKHWVFRHAYAAGSGNFILNGNPNLKSETSQSFNLRFEHNFSNIIKFETGVFYNYVTDMISSVVTDAESDPQVRTYVNINKAMTYGGDINLSSELDRFSWKAGYAYTGAKQKDTDDNKWKDLSLRVTHRVALGAGYKIPVIETKASFDAEWDSRQLISSSDTEGDSYTPDYLMVSAYLGKSFFNEKLELYARGTNLLNNLNFQNGTDGSSQKKYYGLNAGTTFTLGANFKW